jgi:plasmid stabilization system protein ParE
MAKVIWTEPALSDPDAIADYIALDKPSAARELVQRVAGYEIRRTSPNFILVERRGRE